MADKNKLILGTNADTYIAADDQGNIILQNERGVRVQVDNEGIKASVAGGAMEAIGAGGGNPLEYNFSTAIENPAGTTFALTDYGYLNFNTEEIVFEGPGGITNINDVNNNTLNLTTLWQEATGLTLDWTMTRPFGEYGVSQRYGGFFYHDPSITESFATYGVKASLSFDYDAQIIVHNKLRSAGITSSNIKGTKDLVAYSWGPAGSAGDFIHVWAPFTAGLDMGDDSELGGKQFHHGIAGSGSYFATPDAENIPPQTIFPTPIVSPNNTATEGGYHQAYYTNDFYFQGGFGWYPITDTDGKLNNYFYPKAFQGFSNTADGGDVYMINLRLSNFKFKAPGIV